MKKRYALFIAIALTISGCSKDSTSEPTEDPTDHGPIVEKDERTVEEKELEMIQSCIEDYNTGKIKEREEYFQTKLPTLPIGVDQLPQVSSLDDLTPMELNEEDQNFAFKGKQKLNDTEYVVYAITNPTGGWFWTNGSLYFEVDIDQVEKNNPKFKEIKSEIEPLLSNQASILNMLYGMGVTCSEDEVEDGYFPVIAFGSHHPKSIDDIKEIAEEVFTKEFLESNYYPSAFKGKNPIFKMINKKLCCQLSWLTEPPTKNYECSTILNVKEEKNTLEVDLLYSIIGKLQPSIQQIEFVKEKDGYRLPQAY